MFKLDQICRENVKTCHGVEYILIDDFFDPEIFDTLHNKDFLLNYFIINDNLENIYSLSGHPLIDILNNYKDKILTAVNSVWLENCIEIKACASLMTQGNKLMIHNDIHWETVPMRGILYLNDVCGTTFHSDFSGSDPVELGGKPNQLLLFKVSDNSYHSVGLYDHEPKDRFSITLMFDKEK